jgi:hypothetical protein
MVRLHSSVTLFGLRSHCNFDYVIPVFRSEYPLKLEKPLPQALRGRA